MYLSSKAANYVFNLPPPGHAIAITACNDILPLRRRNPQPPSPYTLVRQTPLRNKTLHMLGNPLVPPPTALRLPTTPDPQRSFACSCPTRHSDADNRFQQETTPFTSFVGRERCGV